jgi:signal transduction histidine kinase
VIVRFSIAQDVAILEIEDDGKGFAVIPDLISQTAKGHYGLAGMKERAEAAGGEFLIESSAGTGTTIKVRIPVQKAKRPAPAKV